MVKRSSIAVAGLLALVVPAWVLAASNLMAPAVKPPTPTRPSPAPMVATVPTPEPAKKVPDYQTYNYYGDRYRDPFIALNGEYRSDQGADRPPQVSSLLLKGIIQDERSRMALLTSGASSYILKGGRLYDGRNHLMKGISGVIKPNSVVLMGSDRTVRELKVTATL